MELNEELELFRDNVQRFIEREIAPHYEQWEKDEIFPRRFGTSLESRVCSVWIYLRNMAVRALPLLFPRSFSKSSVVPTLAPWAAR